MTPIEMIAGWRAMGYGTFGTKIAVIRDEAVEVTKAGIIIPDVAKDKPLTGFVIDIGNAMDEEGFSYGIAIGDRISWSKYGGTVYNVRMPDNSMLKVELIHFKDAYLRIGRIEVEDNEDMQ